MVSYTILAAAILGATCSVFASEAPVTKRAEEATNTAAYDPWRHDGYGYGGRGWDRGGYGRHEGYGRGRGWVVDTASSNLAKRDEASAAYDPWRHDGYGRGDWGREGRHDGYGRGRGWVVNTESSDLTKRAEASAAYDPWRHDGYGRGDWGREGRHDGYGRGRGWVVNTESSDLTKRADDNDEAEETESYDPWRHDGCKFSLAPTLSLEDDRELTRPRERRPR
jgi:hypothetical protein